MAQKILNTKIREAYDTEANWIKYNPVLLSGQLAYSSDKYGKYKIGDGVAKWSQLQYMTLGWNDITGKPSSFTPSSHTHDDRYFTETEATNKFSPKEGSASLSKLASTITLGAGDEATILQNGSTYQQKIEIINNSTSGDAVFGFYQSGDSGKNFNKLMTINDDGNVVANKFTGVLAGNASSASSVPWSGVSGKPSTFPPSTHNHPASQITGLPTRLPNPQTLTIRSNDTNTSVDYTGAEAKTLTMSPEWVYGASDAPLSKIAEYSEKVTRYVKVLDIESDKYSLYGRVQQQFLIMGLNFSFILNLCAYQFNSKIFNNYSASYITTSANGVDDSRFLLGVKNINSESNKIELWYKQDQWTSALAVLPKGRSGDTTRVFNLYSVNNTDHPVTTAPVFDISIPIKNNYKIYTTTGQATDGSMTQKAITDALNSKASSSHTHPASQITGLPTKLPNPYMLTIKGNGALLNTYDGSGAKEINITPAVIGAATSGHTHSQYASTSHNHSADNITSGVLPIGRGGTGGTNLTTTASNLQFESIGEGATIIPNNSDLNTYSTPGTYVSQSAKNTGIKNRPTGTQGAFKLVVKYALGNNGYIQQVMTGYVAGTHMEYTRYYDGYGSNKTWSRWVKTFADNSVIPVTSGGTGANTYSAALKNLVINGAVSGSAVPTDTNWYLCSDTADSSGTPVRRPMSSLWSYIKGKTDANYLKLSGTAVSASSIKVPDTRDTNPAPNNDGFKKNSVAFDFKSAAKINSPTNNAYVGLMSFAPWSETSGGNGYQMAFGYLDEAHNTTPKLMLRTADLSATTWGAWYKIYTSADKPTLAELGAAASDHSHSNYATTTNLSLANQRIDTHEKELGVHKTLIDKKASVSHNHDTIYAKSSHSHNTINDCNSGTSIGISSTLGIVPSVSEKYDIVVTNTSEHGNKFVTLDKTIFANYLIDTIPLKAITNTQIDSLASL